MLSSPRRPDTTIRIFSSAVYCLRVLRRISRTVLSAGSFLFINFCLVFVPFGHYDEPGILRYAITSICPKGADVRHSSPVRSSISKIVAVREPMSGLNMRRKDLKLGVCELNTGAITGEIPPAVCARAMLVHSVIKHNKVIELKIIHNRL